MTPETYRIFVVLFVVWGVAVAIKAANALRTGGEYEFRIWDGGMMRAGKRLSRLGMQIKLVVGILMAVGCALVFTEAVEMRTGSYAIMFVALMSIISDFVTVV